MGDQMKRGLAGHLSLAGKRALICGASQGIGEATAMVLAELGAQVVVLARTESKLKNLLSQLPGDGHESVAVDVTDRPLLAEKIDRLLSRAPIEIVVCNTAGPKAGPIVGASEEEFLQGFSNHVL